MTKLQQIRAQCLECVDGQAEVRACAFFACPLWPFRMSRNPFSTRTTFSGAAAAKSPSGVAKVKAGCGVALATLRSWAGHNLPMHSVPSPDPREMTLEELAALDCVQPSPARALKIDALDNDSPLGVRLARVAARKGARAQKQPSSEASSAQLAARGTSPPGATEVPSKPPGFTARASAPAPPDFQVALRPPL